VPLTEKGIKEKGAEEKRGKKVFSLPRSIESIRNKEHQPISWWVLFLIRRGSENEMEKKGPR
jgi:hypothetical protein